MLSFGKVFVTQNCFDSRGECYRGYFDGEIVARRYYRYGVVAYYVVTADGAKWYDENNVV